MGAKTAVVYARVSTVRQASDDLPIDGQIEQCRAKCLELGAEVVRVFADRGISGRKEMRPGFQEAVDFCTDHGISYLVTWSSSRFSRDHIVAGAYKRRLDKHGVQLVYSNMAVDRSTVAGFTLDSFMSLVDEIYSMQIGADTTRSMMKNARDGFFNGGPPPFGYQAVAAPDNPRRKKLVPVAAEAWIVLQIFRWKKAGKGVRGIAQKLNESGETLRGRRWCGSRVHHILRSPVTNGFIVFNRRKRHGAVNPREDWIQMRSHEAIVPDDLWNEVQQVMDSESPENSGGSPLSMYAFTGLLKCGHCGGGMQMETAKGRSKRYAYYNCATWLKTKQCRSHRRPADEMDDWLIDTINTRVFTPEVMREVAVDLNAECGRWATEQRQKLKSLEARGADVARRRSKLFEVLELHGRDAPNLGDISERIRSLNDQARDIKNQIADMETETMPAFAAGEDELAAISAAMREIITDRSNARRTRSMLGQMLESVVLHSDRVEISYKTAVLADRSHQVAVHSSDKWLPVQNVLGTRLKVFFLPENLRRAA